MHSVVLDTNVVIAALRSRRGASFAILRRIAKAWVPLISVPLILEYEAVGKRQSKLPKITASHANSWPRLSARFWRIRTNGRMPRCRQPSAIGYSFGNPSRAKLS